MGQVQGIGAERPWPARQYDMIVDIPQLASVDEGQQETEWRCLVGHHFKRSLVTYLKRAGAAVADGPADGAGRLQHQERQVDVVEMEELKERSAAKST